MRNDARRQQRARRGSVSTSCYCCPACRQVPLSMSEGHTTMELSSRCKQTSASASSVDSNEAKDATDKLFSCKMGELSLSKDMHVGTDRRRRTGVEIVAVAFASSLRVRRNGASESDRVDDAHVICRLSGDEINRKRACEARKSARKAPTLSARACSPI